MMVDAVSRREQWRRTSQRKLSNGGQVGEKARTTWPKADHSPGSPISQQGLMGSWPHSPKMHHMGGTLPWTFPQLSARP